MKKSSALNFYSILIDSNRNLMKWNIFTEISLLNAINRK